MKIDRLISIIFIFVDILGLYPKFNIINIEPILNTSIPDMLHSVLIYIILSIVAFCMLLVTSKVKIKDKYKASSTIFKMVIFSDIVQLLIIFITILVLGKDFISIFRYPEYIALKQFSLFNILE